MEGANVDGVGTVTKLEPTVQGLHIFPSWMSLSRNLRWMDANGLGEVGAEVLAAGVLTVKTSAGVGNFFVEDMVKEVLM